MKWRTHLIPLVICWLASTAPAFSQFYAPETEYHDIVQRCFVVEAARVLAWRENEPKPKISEIAYEVTMTPGRETSWRIKWLGSGSNVIRETTVTYPESLLKEGPKFYRSVFQQIWSLGWRPAPKVAETNLLAEFWRGVNHGGLSRVETLRAAWKFQQSTPGEEQIAPHLAGLLQSAALPASAGAVSLDALLLARSAAWLCLAEKAATNSSRSEACWAPTLFLAGRENAAFSLWKGKTNEAPLSAPASAISEGWDFLLRRPRAKPAFIYAASKKHHPFSMPIIAYYGAAGLDSTVGELMYPIFASEPKTLSRLYDYAPFMSLSAGVPGGRVLEGLWPALARDAWLEAMEAQPISAFDYKGHTNLLRKTLTEVKGAMKKRPEMGVDASVLGLAAAKPMLGEAHKEGLGVLIPTSVVTVRDLLNYGWESTCIQLEARYRFVNGMWGVQELAIPIMTNVLWNIPGSPPVFAITSRNTSTAEFSNTLRRVQFADTSSRALRYAPALIWGADQQQSRAMYARRCWLRPWLISQQIDGFVASGQLQEIIPHITRFHAEAGPLGDAAALNTLVNGIRYETGLQIPGKQKLQEELAQSLLEPSILQVNIRWEQKYEKMPFMERAVEFEKTFWDAPTTGLHLWTYNNYLLAHAYSSARRFYGQVSMMLDEPIQFSNGIGLERYVQGFLDDDRAAMEQALADSDSGSYNNMLMLMWDAVLRDDIKGLEEQIAEAVERYTSAQRSGGPVQRLRDFIPLLPALRDPKHSNHAKALDYFANDSEWAVLQWMMIRKYKLSTEEAVRFLGSSKSDVVRQILVSYLTKNKSGFQEGYDKISNSDIFSNARFVIIVYLRNELFDLPVPVNQLDLRPANAQTIEQAVVSFLEKETP